jgi:nucleotide-binding universal stress UspA family protein
MYSTILVPLDGSKRAEAILPHVEQLAQRFDARVVFLQVVEPITLVVHPDVVESDGAYLRLRQEELERRTRKAESYLTALQGEFCEKGIESESLVHYGPIVDAIQDAAESEGADLITLASHGRTGLSRVFYGSVAAGVLHRVDRPLVLIRSRDEK